VASLVAVHAVHVALLGAPVAIQFVCHIPH
jgi:hypothetical protein